MFTRVTRTLVPSSKLIFMLFLPMTYFDLILTPWSYDLTALAISIGQTWHCCYGEIVLKDFNEFLLYIHVLHKILFPFLFRPTQTQRSTRNF